MSDNFIITVTNNIEGCPIKSYLDTICTNVVVGTNIFSDMLASFSDFFGGRSGSYQSKLELIYNEAIKELKDKATVLGANAIIGFKVDFDEISGKEKSMFMVSASGTACIIENPKKDIQNHSVDTISQKDIDIELKKRFIVNEINKGNDIEETWMEFLYEHPNKDILDELLNRYPNYHANAYAFPNKKRFIEKYLTILPKDDIIDNVYSIYMKYRGAIKELIKYGHLFSPSHILDMAKEDIHSAIYLLDTSSDYYQKKDLDIMNQILSYIDSTPDTGKIETVKGLLGKEHEKFICQCGRENDKDKIYCTKCGKNIKGLTQEEANAIENFRNKVDALAYLLNIS